MSVDIPRLRDLTPEWLVAMLDEAGTLPRHARITSLACERIGTFTTELWRVALTWDPADAGPASLVLKRPAPGRGDRVGESFAQELRFYRDLATRCPVRTPRFYGGLSEPESGRGMVWLEDLPALEPFHWDATESHVHRGVESLARLHGAWWERTHELAWLPSLADRRLVDGEAERFDTSWRRHRAFFEALAGGVFVPVGDALHGRGADAGHALAQPTTLLHGDAHGENLPIDRCSGEIVFLDWASLVRGAPGVDLADHIVMSFLPSSRRRFEQELVAHYAACLGDVAPPFDAWLSYRRGALRRAMRIVGIIESLQGPHPSVDGHQNPVVERCLVAAAELETAELLA